MNNPQNLSSLFASRGGRRKRRTSLRGSTNLIRSKAKCISMCSLYPLHLQSQAGDPRRVSLCIGAAGSPTYSWQGVTLLRRYNFRCCQNRWPVLAMNTSSSDGLPTVTESIRPGNASARRAAQLQPLGTSSRRTSSITLGVSWNFSVIAAANSRASPVRMVTASPPTSARRRSGRVERGQPAVVEDRQAVGAFRFLQQVRREHHRDPQRVAKSIQTTPEVVAGGRVESRTGFIQQQQPRSMDQAFGQLDTAAQSAGERRGAFGCTIRQAELFEYFRLPLLKRPPRQPIQRRLAADVLRHGQLLVDAGRLKYDAQRAADLLHFTLQVVAENLHAALLERRQGGEHAKQRGLAAAVGSKYAEDIPRPPPSATDCRPLAARRSDARSRQSQPLAMTSPPPFVGHAPARRPIVRAASAAPMPRVTAATISAGVA